MRLFFILFAFLFACHTQYVPETPATQRMLTRIYVDADFWPAERAGIYAAIHEWNRAVSSNMSIVTSEDPRAEAEIYISLGRYGDDTLGVTSRVGGRMIRLDRKAIESDNLEFRVVALHELGHALGVGHILGVESLMNPYIGDVDCIDPYTASEVELWYSWKPGSIKPSC